MNGGSPPPATRKTREEEKNTPDAQDKETPLRSSFLSPAFVNLLTAQFGHGKHLSSCHRFRKEATVSHHSCLLQETCPHCQETDKAIRCSQSGDCLNGGQQVRLKARKIVNICERPTQYPC